MGHWQRGLLLFFVFVTMYQRPCFGEQNVSEKKWSLTFKNASVSQILDELTRVTGINIFANKIPEDKTITRSYKDQTVDQIVRDLFRGTSFALVWNDGQNEPSSLDIRVIDGDSGSAPRSFTPIHREFPTNVNPPVRRTLGRPNIQEDSDDSEDIEEEQEPESEEPEETEVPNPPTGSDESSQDESPEKANRPQNPAPGVPPNDGADKGEEDE